MTRCCYTLVAVGLVPAAKLVDQELEAAGAATSLRARRWSFLHAGVLQPVGVEAVSVLEVATVEGHWAMLELLATAEALVEASAVMMVAAALAALIKGNDEVVLAVVQAMAAAAMAAAAMAAAAMAATAIAAAVMVA